MRIVKARFKVVQRHLSHLVELTCPSSMTGFSLGKKRSKENYVHTRRTQNFELINPIYGSIPISAMATIISVKLKSSVKIRFKVPVKQGFARALSCDYNTLSWL